MPSVAYGFYRDVYGGRLSEGGFAAALPHAVAYVDARIWPNRPRDAIRAWRMAVCAACDADAAHGSTGGSGSPSSVTAGAVSMSFDGGRSAWEADMARAVDGELAGSGLLYMGLG